MRVLRLSAGLGLVAIIFGCNGDERPNPILEAFAQRPPRTSVEMPLAFRFPDRIRQPVRLYQLPNFEEFSWRFDDRDLTTTGIVGYSAEEDMIFFRSGALLRSLELGSGRVRTLDTLTYMTTLGPTSTLFTVRTDSTVGRIAERRLELWPDTLPQLPERIWGTIGGRIVAVFRDEQGPYLTRIAEEWDRERIDLPDGPLAATQWGDYVAIAVDNRIIGIRLSVPDTRPEVPYLGTFTSMTFSASGHRLYVLTDANRLRTINRFDFTVLLDTTLAGQYAELRPDPHGRYLFARTAEGDTLDVLNPSDGVRLFSVPTRWTPHVPTTTEDGFVVVHQDDALVAFDPVGGAEAGRVDDENGTWAVVPWDPSRPTLQLTNQAAEETEAGETSNRVFYAQLGSTANLAFATDRVRSLTSAGLPARVVMPSQFDDRYRMVLGPYPSRSDAEDNARRLGQAYFIISFDRSDTTVVFR